jgi:two-component system cell cycle sensor histidine kinase/response regulator CckA
VQSGGAVQVESIVGIGTLFRVLLPAVEDAVPRPAARPGLSARRPAPGRRAVLLVEDDPAVREGVSRMIRASGYDVVEAVDGASAILALEAPGARFDVVLSDIVMPHMDGRSLAREIGRRWPTLPVILSSGYADLNHAQPLPSDREILHKPFELDALALALERAVRRAV